MPNTQKRRLVKLIFIYFHSLWSYHAEAEHKMGSVMWMLVMEKQKKKKKIRKLQREILDFFVWTVSTPFLFSGNIPCTPKVLLEMFITLLKYFHAALHRRQPKNNSSSSETCWLCTGSRSGFSRCSSCLCNALSTSLSLVSLQKCLCTLLNT